MKNMLSKLGLFLALGVALLGGVLSPTPVKAQTSPFPCPPLEHVGGYRWIGILDFFFPTWEAGEEFMATYPPHCERWSYVDGSLADYGAASCQITVESDGTHCRFWLYPTHWAEYPHQPNFYGYTAYESADNLADYTFYWTLPSDFQYSGATVSFILGYRYYTDGYQYHYDTVGTWSMAAADPGCIGCGGAAAWGGLAWTTSEGYSWECFPDCVTWDCQPTY